MTPKPSSPCSAGSVRRQDGPEWRVGGGYVNKIKERNHDEFVSMSEDAGAPEGMERGVYVGGANYKRGDFSIGAIDYYSDDIINIFYTEAKYALPLNEDLSCSSRCSIPTSRAWATT